MNGLIFTTPPISIRVNFAPTAVAKGMFGNDDMAIFDGSLSVDPDGSIVSWDWDFGDGTMATGPTATHAYVPSTSSYTVALTVTDNLGAKATDYLQVLLPAPGGGVVMAALCFATDIQLRTTGATIGKDAKGAAWPDPFGGVFDGKTLGPLSKNPGNKRAVGGFAFEIVGTVRGNPAICGEIQLVKASYKTAAKTYTEAQCKLFPGGSYDAATMICTWHSGWTGTMSDFDSDGTVDLDLSTKAKCEAQTGTWDGTKCVKAVFPKAQAAYQPDESAQGRSPYRAPSNFKSHVNNQIIWYDAPLSPKAGNSGDLDFVAIIRGVDGKYCYDSFTITYEVGKADSEVPTETKKECNVDKTKVPGPLK
jgi:hypothetical protein